MPRTLVFDLDGTLSDPFSGIHNSVNFALAAFGHPAVSADGFADYIGPPIDQTFHHLVTDECTDQVAVLVAKFRERYASKGYAENLLYPDIPETLRATEAVPADGMMIGDREIDIVSAHANGLEAIGVLWGFGSRAELVACGTERLAATPSELLEMLQ